MTPSETALPLPVSTYHIATEARRARWNTAEIWDSVGSRERENLAWQLVAVFDATRHWFSINVNLVYVQLIFANHQMQQIPCLLSRYHVPLVQHVIHLTEVERLSEVEPSRRERWPTETADVYTTSDPAEDKKPEWGQQCCNKQIQPPSFLFLFTIGHLQHICTLCIIQWTWSAAPWGLNNNIRLAGKRPRRYQWYQCQLLCDLSMRRKHMVRDLYGHCKTLRN